MLLLVLGGCVVSSSLEQNAAKLKSELHDEWVSLGELWEGRLGLLTYRKAVEILGVPLQKEEYSKRSFTVLWKAESASAADVLEATMTFNEGILVFYKLEWREGEFMRDFPVLTGRLD
jgi:hypothetical protein